MRGFGSSRAELFAEIDRIKLERCRTSLRLCALEALPHRARLSRRDRRPLIFHPLSADP
jgi:hypothetical protein